MKVRDLERLCAANGVGATKADMVTRSLREVEELRVGGRGANAPDANPEDAAKLLIALTGSSTGKLAVDRLKVLSSLRSNKQKSATLLSRLTELLGGHEDLDRLVQCRIGRNIREAQFIFSDSKVEQFLLYSPKDYSERLRVEGVIPGAFLKNVARLIQEKETFPATPSDIEEHDDS